jgi:aminopeptidase N
MAHPVRPQSYQQINNFYTMTVYNKGAEVVRMLYRLVGPAGFRRATDLYFDRYDGQAVTTDDFVSAVEAADNIDLTQFRLWYDQAGTPVLRIEEAHDPARSSYTLRVAQSCPATPGQPDKHPFHIPLTIALLDEGGSPLPLYCRGIADGPTEAVLQVREASSEYVFEHIPVRPVASVLRGFSAPVRLEFDRVEDDLYFLVELDHRFVEAFRSNLLCGSDDLAFQREMLCLPSESYLAEFLPVIDPMALHVARQTLRHTLAQELEQDFLTIYRGCHDTAAYKAEPQQIGRRALKNLALSYLLELNHTEHRRLAIQQIASSRNMTDVIAALSGLANTVCEERDAAMQSFYARWQGDPLVVDKWLAIQAMSPLDDTLDRVRMLTRYPSFNTRNPNKVRALVGSFAHANPVRFHDPGGAGYEFVADHVIAIDPLNPLLAARLAAAFNQWRRYDGCRQARMRAQLQRIAGTERLSRDVREIVTKALSSDP